MKQDSRIILFAVFGLIGVFLLVWVGRKYLRPELGNGKLQQQQDASISATISPELIKGRPQVEFKTSKGNFILELRPDVAPQTVSNYLSNWANGKCDGLVFHRVESWVVQGCDPKKDGTGGTNSILTELSSEPFVAGAVGVARLPQTKEVSNDSQFFITKTDSTFLNGEYTYFGKVLSGMAVVAALMPGDQIISVTILSK